MSRTLEWKPVCYEELLKEIINTGDMSIESLIIRQQSIEKLWTAIDLYMCKQINFAEGMQLMHKGVHQEIKRAIDQGEFTIEEWNKLSSISDLNYEPLFSIAELEDGKVIINKDRMLSLEEKDLYYWFLDVVKVLR